MKCKQTLFEPNSQESYLSSERDKKISGHLFTSSIKREFSHFPLVVAVTVKKWTRKRDARAELLFCLFNQLLFWRSCCRRRRGILKSLVSCSALFKAFLNLTECKQRIWFLESGKFLFVESAILGFWIQNTAQESGIALNRTWNPESKFHWQRLESSTWNPESGAWNPESKNVLDSLTWGDQRYQKEKTNHCRQGT